MFLSPFCSSHYMVNYTYKIEFMITSKTINLEEILNRDTLSFENIDFRAYFRVARFDICTVCQLQVDSDDCITGLRE